MRFVAVYGRAADSDDTVARQSRTQRTMNNNRMLNEPRGAQPATRRNTLAVLLLGLGLAACAGNAPKPGDSLADAETAVARAERARISDYDAASWKAARENLAKARQASGSKETEITSRWYASRAKADAELGIARAERARLAALTMSLKREIETLQPGNAAAAAGDAP